MAKYKDCYAGPGEVLSTERVRRLTSGASQFGQKAAEIPIIRHYLQQTNPTASWVLAVVIGETNCDWWDKAGSAEAYYKVLVKRHKGVKRADLEADHPKIPDLLTFDGSYGGLASGRHEYYEIKPDNDGGIDAGLEKLAAIESMYRKKRYMLPYKRGSYYPDSDPLLASKPIEIKLPYNRTFEHAIRILLKQGNFTRLRIYMQLRRPEPGLLLYRVCIEVEDDDKRRIRQKVLTKALAKHVYAAYVGAHFPQDFLQLEEEIGDFSYEGEKVPAIRCDWNVADELDPALRRKLESIIYTRGIGLPGDKFVVYCGEAVWQYLVRTTTVSDIWELVKESVRDTLSRLGQGTLWAEVEALFLDAEDVAAMARKVVLDKTLIDVEVMANAVLNFVQKNPGTAIAIAVTPLIITGGVAALLEAGMLTSLVAGSEAGAGVSASVVQPAVSSLGRVAMAEEILLGTRAGAGVPAVLTPASVATSLGGGSSNLYVLKTVLTSPAVKTAVSTAIAASFVLMTVHTQAYAMGARGNGIRSRSTVVPDGASLIAEAVSGLSLAPALDSPRMKPPAKGKIVNLRDVADIPLPPVDMDRLFDARPALQGRYLGTVTVR